MSPGYVLILFLFPGPFKKSVSVWIKLTWYMPICCVAELLCAPTPTMNTLLATHLSKPDKSMSSYAQSISSVVVAVRFKEQLPC